jgi:hypothetical protein
MAKLVTASAKNKVMSSQNPIRHLILIFGDQLDARSPAFDRFGPKLDIADR